MKVVAATYNFPPMLPIAGCGLPVATNKCSWSVVGCGAGVLTSGGLCELRGRFKFAPARVPVKKEVAYKEYPSHV